MDLSLAFSAQPFLIVEFGCVPQRAKNCETHNEGHSDSGADVGQQEMMPCYSNMLAVHESDVANGKNHTKFRRPPHSVRQLEDSTGVGGKVDLNVQKVIRG